VLPQRWEDHQSPVLGMTTLGLLKDKKRANPGTLVLACLLATSSVGPLQHPSA
jgi:hypothetical protein